MLSNVGPILWLSVVVAGTAVLVASLIGLPLGLWLGRLNFRGRRAVWAVVYTGMGLPPVVIGLLIYLLLSRSGPLGFLGWLYTPRAMILAQIILDLPFVVGITMTAVAAIPNELHFQLRTLGASEWQAKWTLLAASAAWRHPGGHDCIRSQHFRSRGRVDGRWQHRGSHAGADNRDHSGNGQRAIRSRTVPGFDPARHRADRQRDHSAVPGTTVAMNDASFCLSRVCRRLSETFRLRIDELTIRRGEVSALLGPTGAGKSTLLRLLTGLEFPDEGDIQFNGAPFDRESPLSVLREITMVHQRPLLLTGSVETNVAYGLRARTSHAEFKSD